MTLFKWSKTASTNATADSTCPFPEGMNPGALNDGTRGMMAAVAKYRDDISGMNVTGGSSAAYTLSTNQVFSNLAEMNGAMLAFSPHVANSGTATLSVDSMGGPKPIRIAPGTDLPTNTLIAGTPYAVIYNNADGAFYLQGSFANPYGVPVGGGIDYWAPTTPNSAFVFPKGQAVSRTFYSKYFSMVGTMFGSGDGSTTFNLPNKMGFVSAMKEDSPVNLTGGYFGGDSTVIGATGGAQYHILQNGEMPQHTHSYSDPGHSHEYRITALYNPGIDPGAGGYPIPNGTVPQTTSTAGVGIAIQNAGGGNAHNNVQRTIICNYILRII